jgi:exonuclease I
MSDVDATIGIANIIKLNDPELWEHMIQFKTHTNVNEYINENQFTILPPTTATGEYTPVSFITSNPDNAKEMIFYNLNEDITDDVINSRIRGIGSLFRNKTLKKIKSNDYPIFLGIEHMSDVLKQKFSKDKKDYIDKAKLIHSSTNFVMNINQYLVDQLADYQVDNRDYLSASDHVDEMLYNGFTGPSDWLKVERLRDIHDAQDLSKQLECLQDKRLIELYKRKMFSDKKNMLTNEALNKHREYISQKIFNEEEKLAWTTLSKARQELSKASADERFQNMTVEFTAIEKYLNEIEKEYS